jgi:hypothetical protein
MKQLMKALPALLLSTVFLQCQAMGSIEPDERQTKPRSLSLLQCVTAGDYLWIEISDAGEVEVLRAGRGLRVFEARRGHLSAAETASLERLRSEAGLPGLPAFLTIQPEEGLIIEDLYYFLGGGAGSGGLVAHEGALPRSVAPLVKALQELARRLPEAPAGRPRMIALPPEILICLGEDAPRAEAGKAAPEVWRTYLERAVETPGQSVSIAPGDLAAVEKHIFGGSHLVRVQRKGREHAVLLLRRSSPG